MEERTDRVNLQALFIEHAAGHYTERALRERLDRILKAIEDRIVEPTKDVLEELAQINISLGEA